jgi:plasmid stabilization system protein ParE
VSKAVSFHQEAALELAHAVEWYAQRSVAASEAFTSDILELLRRISDAPHSFPVHVHGTRRAVTPSVFPFSVVYLDQDDRVVVVAIVHARRRPGYWLNRF